MTVNETVQGWVYLLLELAVLPYLLVPLGKFFPPESAAAWVNTIYYVINFVCCGLIFRRFLGQNLALAGKKPLELLASSMRGFVLHMAGSFLLGYVIELLAPGFSNVNDAAILEMARGNFELMAVGVVLLVPLTEECLFRGLLFQGLHRKSRALAYAVSVLGFCALHIVGYIGVYPAETLLICYLQYVPAGLSLAWAYERADSIFAPILIHAAVNAASFFALR